MRKLLCSGLTVALVSLFCNGALGENFPPPPAFLPPPLIQSQSQSQIQGQSQGPSANSYQDRSRPDIQTSAQTSAPQDAVQLATIFTPFENGTDAYIDYLEKHCRKSLYVADYTFTSRAVADEYCKLSLNGVAVHVILDLSQTRSVKSEQVLIEQLRDAGVEVIITTSPYKHAIMHCKFSVADEAWVEDGSWNYTEAADKQCNYLNFNTEPSAKRAEAFLNAWRKMSDYALSQLASKQNQTR